MRNAIKTGCLLMAGAAGLISLIPASAWAEPNIEGFAAQPAPFIGENSYYFDLVGDQTGIIDINNAYDFNSFADPAFVGAANVVNAAESVTYNVSDNKTTIDFTGSPILYAPLYGNGNPEDAIFGVDEGFIKYTNDITAQGWDLNGVRYHNPWGWLNFVSTEAVTDAFQYLAISTSVITGTTGESTNNVMEIPVPLGTNPLVDLTNGDYPVSISNAGYFLTDSYIDQNTLNEEPQLGETGSPFLPFTALDGLSLGADQVVGGVAVPEPASLALLGLASASTLLRRRRRR